MTLPLSRPRAVSLIQLADSGVTPDEITFPGTVPELLERRAQQSPGAAAYLEYSDQGEWVATSWSDYWQEVRQVAAGLIAMGVEKGQRIAIMLPTSKAWDVMDRAALLAGAVVVGIEPHASADHINYVLQHSEARVLFVSNADELVSPSRQILASLAFVVALKGFCPDPLVATVSWQALHHEASDVGVRTAPAAEDPATLVYTSGTTGSPKGILYTHAQLMLACESILDAFGPEQNNNRWICWLPLANLFQRIFNLCAMGAGARIYLVSDPLQVMQRVETAKPTVFIGVPRFYEKLHEGIASRIKAMPAWQQWMAEKSIQTGLRYQAQRRAGQPLSWGLRLQHRIADWLVLAKLRAVMGGEMQLMLTGSAACPTHILEFFHGIGLPLLEAYGMSENIVPLSTNRPDDFRLGSVGKPLKYNEIRIADDGELLVKGAGVFKGYIETTGDEDGFTSEGFFKTSDFGHFDEQGYLYLTGRKSEVIKTSTGRRISLVRVESALRQSPALDQVVAFGRGRKLLIAVATLDGGWLQKMLKEHAAETTGSEPTAVPSAVKARVAQEIETAGRSLAGYERIRGCVLLAEPFSVLRGELTPNLKLRRAAIEALYREPLEKLYDMLEGAKGGETDSQPVSDEVLVI